MEYVGEENKIQELFHELRLETERITPRFAVVWNRAQAAPARPLRAFNLSLALTTALLVCGLVSLVLWSRYRQFNNSPNVANPKVPVPNVGPMPIPRPTTVATIVPRSNSKKPRPIKFVVHKQAEALALNKSEIRNATAILKWESPTASLLRSPSEQVLTTVPQFNDAVKDLKSFLPATDKPKED